MQIEPTNCNLIFTKKTQKSKMFSYSQPLIIITLIISLKTRFFRVHNAQWPLFLGLR